MIFVTLGTQDKSFKRLLEAIDKEIENGNIKDEVIVQAGLTEYESKNMKIFDLMPADEFDKCIEKSDLIITHGGVGSILTAIKNNKKVIAAARLKKYKEHTNDHQKQIVKEFSDAGYILELKDFNKLGKMIEKAKSFKPKKFKSNTDNFIKIVEDYIEETDNVSWYNKYKEGLLYLFFGGCTTLINIVIFWLLRLLKIEVYVSNGIAWLVAVFFAFFTNKLFVFESKEGGFKKSLKECVSFIAFRLVSLLFDMGIMYLLIDVLSANEMVSKIIANIFVIIINYVFSKLFIFRKKEVD